MTLWLGVGLCGLIALIFSQRYKWWKPALDDDIPRILMYHMVSEHRNGARFNKLRVQPDAFSRQVNWLKDNGYYFAFMSELEDPSSLPDKTVVLTFDDGFEDNFTQAHPVLAAVGARATLYLVEDRHDRDWSVSKKAHHNSGELKDEPKLSDEQVQQMLDSGCWELGGHTRTHANLSKLSRDEKAEEITSSKTALESRFGVRLSSFAYPFGIYDAEDVELAEAAGFVTAVTTVEGAEPVGNNRFELRRVKISGKDSWLAFRIRMRTGQRG